MATSRWGRTPRNLDLREVYVWELPVRVPHWINVICVFMLCVTGYLIGNPIVLGGHIEASDSFFFGTVRFVHFLFSFLFFFNYIYRTYWGFAGNKYARWYNFVPFKKKHWQEIWLVIKVDILQIKHFDIETVGHNRLSSFFYFIIFILYLLQCLTGFGLYAAMSDSWFPKLFAWIIPVLGGDEMTRHIHHVLMWLFIAFSMFHIYLVFYHDWVERRGIASSMIGGWKYIEKENLEE
jgi:Ni/Fe-hydrogenase 1 B-type cytochrome subunit